MADNEQLMRALKDLPIRVQTANFKDRNKIIQDVISVLSNSGVTDKIINGICKLIVFVLQRNHDRKSQFLVKNLIVFLLKEHPIWTVKHMSLLLLDISNQNKTLISTRNTALTSLFTLNWTCILIVDAMKLPGDELKPHILHLIQIQCNLLASIVAAGSNKISRKTYHMLCNSWSSINDIDKLYISALKCAEQNECIVVMGSYLAKYLVQSKKLDCFTDYKACLLNTFIKHVISTKTKPSPAIIESCYPFLRLLTHDEFKSTLLPALQKAMLRNPEVILECVGYVITGLNLDLSRYSEDLGKSLISNLHSKDDLARSESIDACKRLAQQCSDSAAIEQLLKQIFQVFNGSDGKLTVIEHKISVLQGAGFLSYNATTGSSLQKLIVTAAEYFMKVLNVEVHEKTLCHTLDMLSLWCTKLTNQVPEKILDGLRNGINLKTSTSAVRTSYILCISTCLNGSTISMCQSTPTTATLIPVLLKTVERAAAQPAQGQTVTEGLCAACLLVKLASVYEQNDQDQEQNTKFANLWNIVLDMDKQIFVGDKFLAVANEIAIYHVMELCEQLVLLYPDKLNGKATPIHKAIIYCLTSTPGDLRRKCFPLVKKLVHGLGGTAISRALLKELFKFYDNAKIQLMADRENFKESNETQTDTKITGHTLIECITLLCSSADLMPEDAQMLALDALLPTHHPAIIEISPHLWIKIVKHMKLKPIDFTIQYKNKIKSLLIDHYKVTPCYENALSTIIKVNPDVLLYRVIENVKKNLNHDSMIRVTKDDYFTYLTPAGELYDKTVLPGNDENTLNEMNMKRESKAYSYKDQLEELQLRRELEEKRRKEGKVKEPQYTAKQLDAINGQKKKEELIRNRLNKSNSILLQCDSMVRAAARGNPYELSLYFHSVLPIFLKVMQSPLAAPYVTRLYLDLRQTVFPKSEHMSELIGNVTLRLIQPQCDLDPNWEQESLDAAVKRAMSLIHHRTVQQKQHFSAPAFCYTFLYLKNALTSQKYYNDDNDNDDSSSSMLHDGLQVISEHAKLRPLTESNKDKFHPKYLPIKEMFSLLVDLINNTGGRSQSQAVSTLLDVAASASANTISMEEELSVLLSALQSPSDVVRDSALRALTIMIDCIPTIDKHPELAMLITKRIWISKYDLNEENRCLANSLWSQAKLNFPLESCDLLLSDVEHPVECVQQSAGQALAALLENQPKMVDEMIEKLLKLYKSRLSMIPSKQDEFGRIIEQPIDNWSPRRGVALTLTQLAPLLSADSVGSLVTFFVHTSLGDREATVRNEMLNAALSVVDVHGKETVGTLLPVFEQFMDKAPKSGSFDAVRQAVVILMGSLARHLDKEDTRIKPIVVRLISALSTPSQQVQEAVANCLPHLVPSVKEEAPALVTKLLNQLLKSEKYGDRKGAAYGLAGLVKGMGILALKQLDIMTKLTDAIQDKKNYRHREGALFAFEMLCQMLGRLFEPYIVHVLPHLLLCFGDASQYVRNAADDTARIVMSKLSAHGVKLVLPSLLAALEEDSWRTKTGSVELLGAMAYCAPKQLSSCLPSIVPKLIEVLSDSHMKVQEAGAEALKVIGSVIRNPEIQAIVPVLLHALQDPSHKTSACLQTLLDTQFVHFIDAPSLALIMPVVQRAFMDRSTETRKMAAQIIGNMYSLTDQKDLTPYLPTIIPGLKTSLLDPVPEVRSVSARALGAMVRGMGESNFENLLPWLMQTLTSESSSVDRSGAAQGLSEVVGGLGVEKLHLLMPEIIATAERTDIAPHVKDGYIMMFIYMPAVFTAEFTPYIGQIINPILKALADENEYVRDTALKAGQRIVNLYADTAIMLLLPELEAGLFDDNWRIRYSSVQLLGDLLYRISGVTGKMSTETASEDDNFGTEQSHSAIINALGAERRNRVLAGLYMGRSDVALMVRQSALHVWKVVVTNTPRTLREILPTLFGLLLGCLASTSYDKRQVAARTLGDLVRKLGERVLPEIIPILERGLQSNQADQRQGVCIGLSEIMASTSREMVLTFVNSLVPTVRKALCDPLPEVRHAAAKTFDSLHATVGVRALDDILPAMLNQLNDADAALAECTLDGLRQVMAIKSRVVLPYLVPQLTAPPVNTKALSILASVAGEALNKYLHKILPALLQALSASQGTASECQQLEYCQAVVLSVSDEVGVRTIMDHLLEYTKSESVEQRRSAAKLLCAFCATTRVDYTNHVPQLLRGLIHLCTDTDKDVLQMSWEALNAVTKTLEPKQQASYVADVRQSVRYAISDMKGTSSDCDLLPGFCLPKGITPILPIFREAILNGDGDEKEAAAQGLGEMIKVTSAPALQPSVVAITGPLIRILGDRFSWNVKAAVLETLAILLAKVGVMLKQFLPQLQTTFLKALNDTNRQVRIKAATALSYLIVIHVRADPLFTELHNGVKNSDDSTVRETMLQALRGVITPAGDKMSEPLKKQIHATLVQMLGYSEDVTRYAAAGCLGALSRWLNPEQLETTLNDYMLCDDPSTDWTLRHGRSAAVFVSLKESPKTLWTKDDQQQCEKLIKIILGWLQADRVPIVLNAVRACGYLFEYVMKEGHEEPVPQQLLVPFVRTMNHNSNEVKQLLARVCTHLAKAVPQQKMDPVLLKMLLPTLVNGTKEKNSYVKANSEIALITVLRLREGDDTQQKCLNLLDVGARESLSDVVSKVLRKVMSQPEGKEEDLDDTLIT